MSGYPAGKRGLDPRAKSALLWGAVGSLSFLVCAQGYTLLAEPILPITQALTLAVPVGVAAGACAYLLEPRLAAWAADRARE